MLYSFQTDFRSLNARPCFHRSFSEMCYIYWWSHSKIHIPLLITREQHQWRRFRMENNAYFDRCEQRKKNRKQHLNMHEIRIWNFCSVSNSRRMLCWEKNLQFAIYIICVRTSSYALIVLLINDHQTFFRLRRRAQVKTIWLTFFAFDQIFHGDFRHFSTTFLKTWKM